MLLPFSGCDKERKNDEEKPAITSESNSIVDMTEEVVVETKPVEDYTEKEVEKRNDTDAESDFSIIVAKDIENTISALNTEYEQLKYEIDTYDKYLANTDKMEAFYDKIYNTHYNLCVRMREYSLDFAENVYADNISNDNKYDELDELYDVIYEDGGDKIYDEIYDGIMENMYDDYYDGLLDDAYDNEEYSEYSEWLDASSGEYELWLDTSSDIYGDWLDMTSKIYEFWLDIGSAFFDDDNEEAQEVIDDFRKDIEKLKGDSVQTSGEIVYEEVNERSGVGLIDGMRSEFKQALDSYKSLIDEYCELMKKYNENPDDLSLFEDYMSCMGEYYEMAESITDLDEDEMNEAELKYYFEVLNDTNEKLLNAGLQ